VIGGTLLLATRSEGKLREIRPILSRLGVHLTDLRELGLPNANDEELERGDTFAANALAKARHYFEASGGIPTVADDSGIEVKALGGRPGVRSKRWSERSDLSGQALDDANNAALVAALRGNTDRRARYVCVAVFVDAAAELSARGECTGTILEEPRGSGGFGYDPYFLSDELGMTFGEAPLAAKERVSHRGRAFHALKAELEKLGGR
jgi:XTP/dITP diphosphohydrolase